MVTYDNLDKSINLSLLAGLCLVPLMPFAYLLGVNSFSYSIFIVPHLLIFCWAALVTIKGFTKILNDSGRSGKIILLLIVLFLFAALVHVFLPITSRDALIHHLAVPKWWNQAGSPIEISWHAWSYYPMLIQGVFTWFLQMHLQNFCSLYHFAFLVLFAGQIALMLNNLGLAAKHCLLGTLICVSLPVINKLAGEPLVDLALAVFSLQSLWLACLVLQEPEKRKEWLRLGIALGLAVSIKPNGVLLAVVLASSMLLLLTKSRSFSVKIFQSGILTFATALIIYSPWAVRNYSLLGNPSFPFGGDPRRKVASIVPHPRLANLETRFRIYGESLGQVLALPIRIFIEGKDNDPRRFDGILSPLLLLALLPALARKRSSSYQLLYLTSIIFLLVAIFSTSARIRYLSPVYGAWILLAVESLSNLNSIVALLAMLLHCTLSSNYLLARLSEPRLVKRLFLGISDTDYLRASIPEWQAIEYINSSLPLNSKIYLLLTGNKFYYYNRPVITSGHQSEELFASIVHFSDSTQEILQKLHALQITHILVHEQRTSSSLSSLLSADKQALLAQFIKQHLTVIYSSNGYGLWQLQ